LPAALFALQVGITEVLRRRGVMPAAVTATASAEVAACLGVGRALARAAVQVIYHRSRLQSKTKGKGANDAVGLGEKATKELLDLLNLAGVLSVAGINKLGTA